MSAYASTFDHDPAWDESLKRPFLRSAILHLAIVGGFSAYTWWLGGTEIFGDKDAGGAVVGIEVVDKIPLPSRGETNPVANDTKSVAPPAPPVKEAPKAQPEPPSQKGVALEKAKAKQPPPAPERTLRPFEETSTNQLTSKTLPSLSSPMYAVAGSGRIGVGENTTLGARFPGYAAQIRQIVERNWQTADVEASIKTAPQVTVVFDLMRNGTVRGIVLKQRSGVSSLDFSVQRAIQSSNFPPLPPEYERESIEVEFQFELRR